MPTQWTSRPEGGTTTVLATATAGGQIHDRAGTAFADAGAPPARPGGNWLARHPAWPVTALLAGYPLWWALGVAEYMFVLLAIPMAGRIYAWSMHGRRRIRVPPGFTLWLLFLLCVLAGATVLSVTAPGTIASPVSNRVIAYAVRTAQYFGVTVLLIFVGNLTERELPRQRLAWLLGLVALYAIAGGVGGVLFPNFHFTSPLTSLIPHRLQAGNLLLHAQLHPSLSQVQNILGVAKGRPDAPFTFTNEWGYCLALLLPWLVVAWVLRGTRRQRLVATAALVVVIVPVIYSLDRGLWIALLAGICYLGLRLATRGRFALLSTLLAVIVIAAVVIVATPLQGIISQRLAHGHSNASRASLSVAAIQTALSSPLVGYGGTRHQQGSARSVSVGRSDKCPNCGNVTIGGNGQLWMLLICDGFLGTALYLGFFGYGCWRYRRDRTPYGLAGVLVLLLTFVFMVAYNAVGAPLGFTMLAYALLWRNDQASRQQAGQPPVPGVRGAGQGTQAAGAA